PPPIGPDPHLRPLVMLLLSSDNVSFADRQGECHPDRPINAAIFDRVLEPRLVEAQAVWGQDRADAVNVHWVVRAWRLSEVSYLVIGKVSVLKRTLRTLAVHSYSGRRKAHSLCLACLDPPIDGTVHGIFIPDPKPFVDVIVSGNARYSATAYVAVDP